jgi:hypothetical protein
MAAAPGLVAGEQVRRRAAAGVSLEVDVGERLAVVVLEDDVGAAEALLYRPEVADAARGNMRCDPEVMISPALSTTPKQMPKMQNPALAGTEETDKSHGER